MQKRIWTTVCKNTLAGSYAFISTHNLHTMHRYVRARTHLYKNNRYNNKFNKLIYYEIDIWIPALNIGFEYQVIHPHAHAHIHNNTIVIGITNA